jgi:acetyl-CoA/propionyl-CoA carboxylase biotin carboxyl carrier protein
VYYDPMIAKLIVHAADRQQGLDRMARALREFLILGVKTSIPLHRWLMSQADVRSGAVDTGWLERAWSSAHAEALAQEEVEAAAVAAALLADATRSSAAVSTSLPTSTAASNGWRLAARRAALH